MACMYKVGDAVRVRPDIKDDTYYKMVSGKSKGKAISSGSLIGEFKGQIVHIKYISCDEDYYVVKENQSGVWTDEMFLPIKPFTCKSLL